MLMDFCYYLFQSESVAVVHIFMRKEVSYLVLCCSMIEI